MFTPLTYGACACMCVDGKSRTVCTTETEAAGTAALCTHHDADACPTPTGATASQPLDAPSEQAENCRTARAYDRRTGSFAHDINVCDVVAAQ